MNPPGQPKAVLAVALACVVSFVGIGLPPVPLDSEADLPLEEQAA